MNNSGISYSLTVCDITSDLTGKTRKPVCNYVLIRTEHSKLLINYNRNGIQA